MPNKTQYDPREMMELAKNPAIWRDTGIRGLRSSLSRQKSRHLAGFLELRVIFIENPDRMTGFLSGFFRSFSRDKNSQLKKQLKPPRGTASLLLSHLVNEIKRRQRSWSHLLTKPLLSRAYMLEALRNHPQIKPIFI